MIFKLFKNTTLDFGTLISVVCDLFPQPFARSRQQWLKISTAVGSALSFSLQAWDLWSTVKHYCQFCFLIALLHDADLYYTAKTNVVTSQMCSAFLVSVIAFLTKIIFWLIVDSVQKVLKIVELPLLFCAVYVLLFLYLLIFSIYITYIQGILPIRSNAVIISN